uniref:CST complex subunit STN1 n=1 Tax=Arion vulgaris TaxID=1028688 RepID=A0A0B6YU88_9EUPU
MAVVSSDTKSHHINSPSYLNKRSMIGLDPVFRSYVKIKIKDLKQLQLVDIKDSDAPGGKIDVYCFMNHVVNKIEVMGIVVMVDRKEQYCSFAVDDATGVVLCIQWTNNSSQGKLADEDLRDLPASLQQKLEAYNQSLDEDGLHIGDLVQVRGYLTTYRDQKQIYVYQCITIDNPCVEIESVLEYGDIYQVYKQQTNISSMILKEQLDLSLTKTFNHITVQHAITQHIQDSICSQTTVTPHDIILWQTVMAIIPECKDDDDDGEKKQIHLDIIKLALQSLESNIGSVYMLPSPGDTYEIIRAGCPLASKVLSLLRHECQTGQNTENGCHLRQLQAKLVRKEAKYARVQTQVMSYLFSCLEASSQVICVIPQRYISV